MAQVVSKDNDIRARIGWLADKNESPVRLPLTRLHRELVSVLALFDVSEQYTGYSSEEWRCRFHRYFPECDCLEVSRATRVAGSARPRRVF